jgi:hypothetical protein
MIPRRDPQAILLAHEMDPARKELYVEGPSDRLFLLWIASDRLDPNAIIHDIAVVEVGEEVPGGERGRLLNFARTVERSLARISFFADADYDRILGRTGFIPANVVLTDGRDLEGYFLRQDCFEKIVRLALGIGMFPGVDLQKAFEDVGRLLGCLRLYSEMNSMSLPFQSTNLRKHVRFSPCQFKLNLKGYVSALANNAGLGGKMAQTIIEGTHALLAEHDKTPSTELIHGKDILVLLSEVLRFYKIDRGSSEPILRTSFEPGFVKDYRSLSSTVNYIVRAQQP